MMMKICGGADDELVFDEDMWCGDCYAKTKEGKREQNKIKK